MAAKHVTDASFTADVLQSDKPVLVDFWAEWCNPCKLVSPVLEEIANEHAEKLTIVKLNIDENPETARAYQIMSIPTMSVFQGGQIVKNIVGAKPKAALLRDLEAYL
ncbi:MAG: thioredoxin 1 [Frankiales bacterium]|nr:thioredoxin 1 [Frankiales bacterium]MDX6254124.1 thioredoxin 1 [Frankiales bacterium]